MSNLNGRLYTALFLGFFTCDAFAGLIAQNQWEPGADCYSGYTDYKVAVCDCIGYQGSMGPNWPSCDTNTPPSMPCLMGTRTMHFHYPRLHSVVPNCMNTNEGGAYRDVKYYCYDAGDWDVSSVCDCVDMDTDWEIDSTGTTYTKQTATFQCGTYDFSTYCEYQMMDPITEQYETYTQGTLHPGNKNYVCGPADLLSPKTEYACAQGFYLAGTTCKDCPTADSVDGVAVYSTAPDMNTGNVRSCYVPANSFSVSDDYGKWTWGNNCYYGS